jgi:tetratricopeptide (TPR) repeat protein
LIGLNSTTVVLAQETPIFYSKTSPTVVSNTFPNKLEYALKEKAFLEFLEKDVLPYLQQKNTKISSCFISYAWGNLEHELWVEKFAEHLEKAGIKVFLDRWEDRKGKVLNDFIKKIEKADWTIVVGTKLYLQKSNKEDKEVTNRDPVVKSEIQLIEYFIGYNSTRNDKIIPVLLEGSSEESLPFFLRPKLAADFTKNDYFQELLKLIHDLYGIDNRDKAFISFFGKLKEYWLVVDASITELERKQYQGNLEKEYLERQARATHEVKAIKEKLLKEYSKKTLVWNLPRQDHKFIGRKELLEELQTKLHLKSTAQLALKEGQEQIDTNALFSVSVCAGLGGIGKTQLALQYMHHSKYPYTIKAWFLAENLDQLKQQYIEFAKMLGYKESKPSIEAALPYVKNWLSEHPGWLLVYDNVNSYNEIKDFLPVNGGSIILTTRQRNWPNGFEPINIDVMSEEECIELVQSLIRRRITEIEKKEVKELAKILGYLPLALAQAGAYIRQSSIPFLEYLKIYKKYEKEFLTDDTLPEGVKSVPVAATWNITLGTIVKEAKIKNQPPLALHLLTACAYLAPEKIPRHLLLNWLKESYPNLPSPELVLSKLIGQLWQYSIISRDNSGDITVHRLVQAVLRYQHQTLEKKKSDYLPLTLEWYNTLFKAVHAEFYHKTQVLEDELRQKNLLPHLQILLNHYKPMWPNDLDFNLVPVLNDIGTAFFLIGEHKIAKSYYGQALPILERHYGKDHFELTNTLDQLGRTYRYLGDAKQAKAFHEHSLKIKEQYYGKNSIEVALTLDYLGRTYRYLGDAKQAKAFHEHSLKIKEQYYGADHIELAWTLDQLGRVARYLGDVKQAKELHERALKIKQQYYDNDHIEVAWTLDYLGRAYRDLGDAKQTKELHERALKIKQQYYGENHIEIAWTLDYLGRVYRYLGDAKQAKELHERALKIKQQYYGENHIEIAWTLDYLGRDYIYLGDAKQAKELHERASKIKEQYYGKDHIEVAWTLDYLGRAYRDLGDAKQAKELHERALKIKEQHYGNNHFEVALTLDHLGSDYRDLGYSKQAKELHERALKINEQHYNRDHFEVARTLDQLGETYRNLGDAKQAKAYHERALKIKEQYYSKDHVEVAFTLDHLGRDYRDLGDAKQAKELHERALKIKEQYYGNNHPETSDTYTNLGRAYMVLNNAEQAKIYLEQSLIIKERYYGLDHPDVTQTLIELGNVYKSLGNIKQAQTHLERALKIRGRFFGENHPLTMEVKQATAQLEGP